MSNRRFWIMLMLVVTLLAALSAISQLIRGGPGASPSDGWGDRSVYQAGASGTMAWHKALTLAGIRTTIWREPFATLTQRPGTRPTTLVMIAPLPVVMSGPGAGRPLLDTATQKSLVRWVAQGHTLIWLDAFDDPRAASLLMRLSGARVRRLKASEASAQGLSGDAVLLLAASAPPGLASFVRHPLKTRSERRFFRLGQGRPLLHDTAGRPVLIVAALGQGRVILGCADDLASNRYLHDPQADNLQYLANLLIEEGKPVRINEFVHGHHEAPSLLDLYLRSPLAHTLRYLVLLAMLVLWLAWRPWRPVRPEMAPVGSAEQGFYTALAWQYRQTRSPALALGPQIQALAHSLRTRHRVDLHNPADDATLLAWLASHHGLADSPAFSEASIRTLLATLRGIQAQSPPMPAATLLALSHHMARLQEVLDHGFIPGRRDGQRARTA